MSDNSPTDFLENLKLVLFTQMIWIQWKDFVMH